MSYYLKRVEEALTIAGPLLCLIFSLFGLYGVGFGFVGGIISSILFSLAIDKRKNIIYSKERLSKFLNIDNILELSLTATDQGDETLELFINKMTKTNKINKIAFIKLGELNDFDLFSKQLSKFKKDISFISTTKLLETKDSDLRIIIATLGNVTQKETIALRNKINIENQGIHYLIILKL